MQTVKNKCELPTLHVGFSTSAGNFPCFRTIKRPSRAPASHGSGAKVLVRCGRGLLQFSETFDVFAVGSSGVSLTRVAVRTEMAQIRRGALSQILSPPCLWCSQSCARCAAGCLAERLDARSPSIFAGGTLHASGGYSLGCGLRTARVVCI